MRVKTKHDLDSYYQRIQFAKNTHVNDRVFLNRYKDLFCFPNQFYYIVDYRSHQIALVGGNIEGITGYKASELTLEALLHDVVHDADHANIVKLSVDSYRVALDYKDLWSKKGYGDYSLVATYKMKHRYKRDLFVLRNTAILQTDQKGNVIYGITFITNITGNINVIQDQLTAYVTSPFGEYIHLSNTINPEILTSSEKRILFMLYSGDTSKQIGTRLSISSHTVDTHRRRLLQKLNANNTPELISKAIKHQLIKPF
jgi:DNA-binding CsgD family transcriptional regulator